MLFLMDDIYWGISDKGAKHNRGSFQEFLEQTPEQIKEACCDDEGRLFHIVNSEHFDLQFLKNICDTAHAARNIVRFEKRMRESGNGGPSGFLNNLLNYRSVLNYFKQPSTRTLLSFSRAESQLGIQSEDVRDIRTSSESKGESERDSLRTISSYFHAIVARHPSKLYGEFAAWALNNSDRRIPAISGGSGPGEHPTQGLLDYYTMHTSFDGDLDGKTIAFVGDCLRGRTVHSGARILSLHDNMRMLFVAPEEYQIDSETEDYVKNKGVDVEKVTEGLRDVIKESDVVYMTRIQNEHGGTGEYDPRFVFTLDCLDLLPSGGILMHPMPKREEIDPRIDDLSGDQRVMYWREQRNGMWTRVALLSYLFKVDEKIRDYYQNMKQLD
jgi:aspartate carbamoyltransferase catalytic subunit